jgi:uncharacterized membrane protein YkvA (DUF1232 family)
MPEGRKTFKERLRATIKKIYAGVITFWLALRAKRLPFASKIIAFVMIAYALSPIDLIPDFIPVIGLLDEVLLIPVFLGLLFTITPKQITREYSRLATAYIREQPKPKYALGIVAVIFTWALTALLVVELTN